MNTEIMNNIEEVTEVATNVVDDVMKVDNGFGKGVAVGTGIGLAVAGAIKLVVTGIKKHKAKKYIEAEVVDVTEEADDEVEKESKKNK